MLSGSKMSLSPPAIPPTPPPPTTGFLAWISRPLGMVITMGAIGALALLAFLASYLFSTSNYQLSPSQKACVVTAEHLAERHDIALNPAVASWDSSRYLDGSVDIDYMYEDSSDQGAWIHCMLSIQPSTFDAKIVKESYWQGSRISYKGVAEIEQDSSVFSWGDASRFAYLKTSGVRYGFLFVTRKDSKVFYLEIANCGIEDPDEISALLTPLLERYESETF